MANRTLTVLALATAIAGCTPSEEQLAAAAHATCVEYGYPMEHPEYGTCRMLVRQMRVDEEMAKSARGVGMMNAYSNYLRATRPY